MSKRFTYKFPSNAVMPEVESAIVLALLATEGLHGESLVRLELRHYLDAQQRALVVDASTEVGRDFNRILTSFLTRELSPEGFVVQAADAAAAA